MLHQNIYTFGNYAYHFFDSTSKPFSKQRCLFTTYALYTWTKSGFYEHYISNNNERKLNTNCQNVLYYLKLRMLFVKKKKMHQAVDENKG